MFKDKETRQNRESEIIIHQTIKHFPSIQRNMLDIYSDDIPALLN